jgi:PHP family Zn ribbon phosphoesterase
MNDSNIMKWASKSGINIHTGGDLSTINPEFVKILKKFAKYSADYERQLIVKICKREAQYKNANEIWTACAEHLANKIQARGQA